jgi:hypothetical protein
MNFSTLLNLHELTPFFSPSATPAVWLVAKLAPRASSIRSAL